MHQTVGASDWLRLRRRLSFDPPQVMLGDGSAIVAQMYWRRQELPAAEVGEIDETQLPPGAYAVAAELRDADFAAIEQDGYATRLHPSVGTTPEYGGLYFYWSYPPLHRDLSEHFLQTSFANKHTFGLSRQPDGSFALSFCGRNHARPYLEGTLSIAVDTSLVSAQWTFITPRPAESAGGEVTFLAPGQTLLPWSLVPLRSAFWRRIGGSRTLYFQESSVYREWRVGPGIWP